LFRENGTKRIMRGFIHGPCALHHIHSDSKEKAPIIRSNASC
jgi:hypothetical protein